MPQSRESECGETNLEQRAACDRGSGDGAFYASSHEREGEVKPVDRLRGGSMTSPEFGTAEAYEHAPSRTL
jgi:hypothetical protein